MLALLGDDGRKLPATEPGYVQLQYLDRIWLDVVIFFHRETLLGTKEETAMCLSIPWR